MIIDDGFAVTEKADFDDVVVSLERRQINMGVGAKNKGREVLYKYDRNRTQHIYRRRDGGENWNNIRYTSRYQFSCYPGFHDSRRAPPGYCRSEINALRAEAKEKAQKDMAKIIKNYPDVEDIAHEATLVTLEVMRASPNPEIRLKAAKQLLEYYKQKPVTKSDVTVATAEAWLASLDDHEDEIETDEDE